MDNFHDLSVVPYPHLASISQKNVRLSQEKILMIPYDHILQCTGKKIRSKLIEAFNHWLNIPANIFREIQDVVEMLHNASLLLDDIEDSSDLRRGLPTAHNIYGVPLTINAANYAVFLSMDRLQKNFPKEYTDKISRIFVEQLLFLHQGQGLDIYWRDAQVCPTMEEYLDMVSKKTSSLFGLALRLMQLFSDNKQDYSELVNSLGIFFQVRDDYANLLFDEYAENKTFAEDLTEGKYSFPVVWAIQNHPEDVAISNVLRLKTKKIEIKKFAVNHLKKLEALDNTLKYLKELQIKIQDSINNFNGNPELQKILEMLYIEPEQKTNTPQGKKEQTSKA